MINKMKFLSAWKRPSKEFHNILNSLRTYSRIACGTAKSHQETNMTANAVADSEKRERWTKKTLLKNGGERIVEIGGLCESEQFLNDLRSLRREAKEIRKDPESTLHAILHL